ncbi:MAG: hypothetical protein JNL06_17685 [Alphaproteobacteria bacterium]|nr:hypothetical protein [Alphaproteobacteria bacterium]
MAKRAGMSGFDPSRSPLEVAYLWGKQGVEISTSLLQSWLNGHTKQNLEHRRDILKRRISGSGAWFQHGSAVVLGLFVFITALWVDYNIISEFWTRALSNEFGEVPPGLANTVAAKSLQVLFATLAVHYLVSNIGHGGRVTYSILIFLITAVMVIGIGLLWANNSLPAGAKVFGLDVNQSAQQVDQFMKGLGIKPPRAAPQPAEVKLLKKYELIIWLFSLGVIFLVVASIGAMALHTAMRGFTGFTGGALYDTNRDVRHGNSLRDELKRTMVDLSHLEQDEGKFRRSKVAEFLTTYTDGVVAGGFTNGRRRRLLDLADEASHSVDTSPMGDESSDDNVEDIRDHRRRAAQT